MRNRYRHKKSFASNAVIKGYEMLNNDDKRIVIEYMQNEAFRVEAEAKNFSELNSLKKNTDKPICCPKCHCTYVVKNGKTSQNQQRYICRNCKTTFSLITDTLISNSNQDIGIWYRFISGFLRQESIAKIAEDCKISQSTAMNWRLKVFYAIEVLMSKIKLSGVIIADDTRFDYNLKGNHNDDFIMPRNSRKRGSENTYKNYHKNSICVLCAIDNNNRSFSRIIGFGNPSAVRILRGFENRMFVDESTILVTDGAKAFRKAVDTYGIPRWERRVTKTINGKRYPNTDTAYHIQKINAYHSNLKRFISRYKGVSSRYLPGYLLLFDYLQNNKNNDFNYCCKQILCALSAIDKSITNKELESRYAIPVSNGAETELWEVKIPRKEQAVYRDWLNKMPIQEIVSKHHINRRKIYTIKDKIEKYGVEDKILNAVEKRYVPKNKSDKARKPISERDWRIYLLYNSENLKLREIALMYNISISMVHKIIRTINKRPESVGIRRKKKTVKSNKIHIKKENRNNLMYADFKFLKGSTTNKRIYNLLSAKYGLTYKSIEGIIYKKRNTDELATYTYRWKDKALEAKIANDKEFFDKRNFALYLDFAQAKATTNLTNREIYNIFKDKYNLSFALTIHIYYDYRRRAMQQGQNQELEQAV